MTRRMLRLAWYTLVHLAYSVGLRGYCWVCDSSRWAWTHRRCGRRHHEAAAQLAAALAPHLDAILAGDQPTKPDAITPVPPPPASWSIEFQDGTAPAQADPGPDVPRAVLGQDDPRPTIDTGLGIPIPHDLSPAEVAELMARLAHYDSTTEGTP